MHYSMVKVVKSKCQEKLINFKFLTLNLDNNKIYHLKRHWWGNPYVDEWKSNYTAKVYRQTTDKRLKVLFLQSDESEHRI